MSGIKVGGRLEQLLALRRRVDTELVMLGHRSPLPAPTGIQEHPDDPMVLVPLSHVEKSSIRAWSGGDPHRRGTLPSSTIDAYALAHRPWAQTGAW